MLLTVPFHLRYSEAYALGAGKVTASPAAIAALGSPISTGWPGGSLTWAGPKGTATLGFAVHGPIEKGEVSEHAVKRDGAWTVTNLRLRVNGQERVISLLE